MSALNVRIDPETAASLERLVHQTGRTRSDLVRQAIQSLHKQATQGHLPAPAEAMAQLIGCWDSGGMRLSERTGERFAQLLQERKHDQRPGRRRSARRAH
jgi:hypothetical protein